MAVDGLGVYLSFAIVYMTRYMPLWQTNPFLPYQTILQARFAR